jgi:hypothetical protein
LFGTGSAEARKSGSLKKTRNEIYATQAIMGSRIERAVAVVEIFKTR